MTQAAARGISIGPAGATGALGRTSASPAAAAVTGLRRDHWTGLIGRTVEVDGRNATVVGVEDLAGAPSGDAKRFSVELRTDPSAASLAGTRPVVIPGRGTSTLLISPVDRGHRHCTYQIVVHAA